MEGFPLMRSECAILTPPEKPIDLLVHTPGGLVLAASQIAHAIESHKGKVTVFILLVFGQYPLLPHPDRITFYRTEWGYQKPFDDRGLNFSLLYEYYT